MTLDPHLLAAALVEGAGNRLAVYGSLRPGGRHHDLVEDLGVRCSGTVTGRLDWFEGYPLLRRPGAERVPVVVLEGEQLTGRWAQLDRFEGPAYCRELVLVAVDGGGMVAAQCYLAWVG